jgi:hypothetical protein
MLERSAVSKGGAWQQGRTCERRMNSKSPINHPAVAKPAFTRGANLVMPFSSAAPRRVRPVRTRSGWKFHVFD